MLRWIAVASLLVAAIGSGYLAVRSTSPRGLNLSMYDNLRWSGSPTEERVVRHVDFTPRLRRNPIDMPEKSSLRMDGFVYAPRGGNYDFRIRSTADAWVQVSDKTVVTHRRGRDQSDGSIRLTQGYHPINIRVRHRRGEPRFFIEWRLPSGYMNIEALAPVYLHPKKPVGEDGVPTGVRWAPVLLLLLALLVAAGPRVVRFVRLLSTDRGRRQRVATGLFLVLATLGVRAWDLNGAGETSDEWAYASAGRTYVSNAVHGYWQSLYWHANEEHPPIGKYLYGTVSRLAGNEDYGPLRAASAFCAALTVWLTWRFGARFLSPGIGLLAGLILVFLPPFVAHGKVAALDSPSCALFTLGVYLFVDALMATRNQNARYLLSGLIACLAFATKFSNATIFIFMAVLHFVSQWPRIRRRGALELPLGLYVLPALPLVVLFLVWPWLWREPFGQLVTTLKHWDYPIREWFLGAYRQPPFYYFPIAFVAATPALLLGAFGAFWLRYFERRNFELTILVLWFLTPFLWTVSVLKQDGIRYIYNMYPAFALIAAVGVFRVVRAARWRRVATGLVSAYLFAQCWLVHPYYLDYYSEAVGGTGTVYRHSLFEVGWWGEGMDRAYTYINEHASEGQTWDVIGVVNHTSDMLRDDLVYTPNGPDWLVKAYLVPQEEERDGYHEMYRVDLFHAPLVIVYLREDLVQSD